MLGIFILCKKINKQKLWNFVRKFQYSIFAILKNNVNIETVQALGKQSPEFENSFVRFNVKYAFNFLKENDSVNKPYFTTYYVIIVTFETLNVEKTRQLLAEKELLNVFVMQQLKKTLWPVLRGTLLDSMGRHSLQSIPLTWIKL